jgi:acyl dehydratase
VNEAAPAFVPDFGVVGVESAPVRRAWTVDDTIRYALGVGAGSQDPAAELNFTTENSAGAPPQVLPTFATVLTAPVPGLHTGRYDPAAAVHAEQSFELHAAIPVSGAAWVTAAVTGIYDLGSGALTTTRTTAVDESSGQLLITAESASFIRHGGGFGGSRPPAGDWPVPTEPPDQQIVCPTRPDQALLYRLSGDRNPLHSDPVFARRAGFPRPILHGLCTYGMTGRALLATVAGGDPARLTGMSGRFTNPVYPGDTLVVSIWTRPGGGCFRTARWDGAVVVDRGRCTTTPRRSG